MTVYEIILYIMGAAVFVMLLRMVIQSRKIVIEVRSGPKWIVPLMFVVVAVIGITRYTGAFRIIQTILLLTYAVMYYNIRSGFADEGIVSMGTMIPYEKAGTVTLNKNNNCILYRYRGRDAALFIDPDQIPEIREFLQKKSRLKNR
ncbi:MAG: hypothetical protein IKG46_05290 [Solobacterium sp.]|nr:hypothetical protein [Solobacterium sp.]